MVANKEQVDFWINFCIENYLDSIEFLSSDCGISSSSSSWTSDSLESYSDSSYPTYSSENDYDYDYDDENSLRSFLNSFSNANEEFKKRYGFEVTIKHGYDKIVFLSEEWDYVVKLSFRSDSREPFIYQEAILEDVAFIFPETIAYREIKISREEGETEPFLTVTLQENCFKSGNSVDKNEYVHTHPFPFEKFDLISSNYYKERSFLLSKSEKALGCFLASNFSVEQCMKIASFFLRFNINDLANRNYTITDNNKLLVFDFAGASFFKDDYFLSKEKGDVVC